MDAKLLNNVRDVSKGILLFDVVVIVILLATSNFSKPMFLGLIFGSLIAILNFRLLALSIEKKLAKITQTNSKSQLLVAPGFGSRILIWSVVLYFSATAPHLNIIGTALGLISPQFVIVIKKLFIDKFKERRSKA